MPKKPCVRGGKLAIRPFAKLLWTFVVPIIIVTIPAKAREHVFIGVMLKQWEIEDSIVISR